MTNEVLYAVVECLVPIDESELASSELIDLDTTGIEEVAAPSAELLHRLGTATFDQDLQVVLRAGFANQEAAEAATGHLRPLWPCVMRMIDGGIWMDSWREYFEPQTIGRFVIIGDWPGARPQTAQTQEVDSENSCTTIEIRLDPQRSFGTGAHPSTALVLEALQAESILAKSVADIGCGSGILSVAAALLGAIEVFATDVDDAALAVTLDNARRNGVGGQVRSGRALLPTASGEKTFDVVIANILAPVLIENAVMIASHLHANSVLLLSGFIDDQTDSIVKAFTAQQLDLVAVYASGNWRCAKLLQRQQTSRSLDH